MEIKKSAVRRTVFNFNLINLRKIIFAYRNYIGSMCPHGCMTSTLTCYYAQCRCTKSTMYDAKNTIE